MPSTSKLSLFLSVTHILTFLMLLLPAMSSECMSEVSTRPLPRGMLTNQTSLLLTWSCPAPCCPSYPLKVKVEHLQFLACTRGTRRDHQDIRVIQTEPGGGMLVLENLHPYSVYNISLSLEREVIRVKANTRPSVPETRARHSAVNYRHKDTAYSLTFTWVPPSSVGDCDQLNCKLGGYSYSLLGRKSRISSYPKTGTLPLNQTKLEVTNLLPSTHYTLFLHLSCLGNTTQGTSETFLKMEKTTLPALPRPPSSLTVKTDGAGHHLTWREPGPPSGHLTGYRVKWIWPGGTRYSPIIPPSNPYYSIPHPEKTFNISVQTFNKGLSEGSEWTEDIVTSAVSSTLSTPAISSIVLAAIFLIIALLTGLRLAVKMSRRRQFRGDLAHYLDQGYSTTTWSSTTGSTCLYSVPGIGDSRSPADPLPDVPRDKDDLEDITGKVTEQEEEDRVGDSEDNLDKCDVEGYLKTNFGRPARLSSSGSEETLNSVIQLASYLPGRPTGVL